jgi:demethylmenaquinone methyltransferase/2-methoxy-6-polyprenyl-1,4-benzoquinol methylase
MVNKTETVLPYKSSDKNKKTQVAEMFDNIAHKYDFLNHFLSLNIDKIWRRKAIQFLKQSNPQSVLDVATGTGDFAVEIHKRLSPKEITGIDISTGMLKIAEAKIKKKALSKTIRFQEGDSELINFPDNRFDAVTVAFGVRNFENLQQGINEIYRVLKPGGEIVVLEFSRPEKFPIKQLYNFYFKRILPSIGRMFSKDTSAYSYLPESVDAFPYGKRFFEILTLSGFIHLKEKKLAFGISSVYYAKK